MILTIGLVFELLFVAAAAAADSFPITSPRQTDRSVMLAWEPDQEVRTVRNSCQWNSSTPTDPPHEAAIVPGEGRGGSAAARIRGNASEGNARGCVIQNLEAAHAAGRYEYQLFYRSIEQQAGKARLVIDCYLGPTRTHHGLVSRDLPAAEDWSPVSGAFELPEGVQLLRCLVYQVGKGTSWFDDVRIASESSPANLLGDPGFDGIESWRVLYRKKGEADWQPVDAVVLERFHHVIFLEPATEYEFLVRRVAPEGTVRAESQVLAASTKAAERRVWNGFQIPPDQRMATQPAVYPCIESVAGKLYYSECRGGTIWLSQLDESLRPVWTKPWVEPFLVDGKPCYQGQTQSAVLDGTLYLSWKRAYRGDAPYARQCIASYDTRTGKIAGPFVIEPKDAAESTWNGGIAAVDGQLWVSYCRWRELPEGYRTTVTVRTLDPGLAKLGPPHELNPQPTETPYTPFLSVFDGELVVAFTDSAAKTDRQPLWLVRFDGTRFHDLVTVSSGGFNQYAKGVQVGDRLALVWKYGEPYPARIFGSYMFHDVGLALVDPKTGAVEKTSLVDDVKYNSSPDITRHNDCLVYVYNKFEHLYGGRNDPGKLYGCFIGRLRPATE
ncbi:MAG: fibronectin type III domain-containing protein [Candidatus Anammoximicrobium sp.]|nr:fibronectin type III domain-containing protein [Candidatus Anammoximicrobium sp.]